MDDLRSKAYDYWALGHVHEFEIVSTDPYVVFPGNVQGRTIRETGAKGAVIVTVADNDVMAVQRIDLDVIRWARVEVDCGGVLDADVADLVRAELARLHGSNASGHPLVVRVTLAGETIDAGALYDRAASLRDDVRAIASSISADLFIEKVKVLVTAPVREAIPVGEDLGALIDEAAIDPALAGVLQANLEKFMLVASTMLGEPEDGELRLSATRGDWPALLSTVSTALRSRLMREG